MSSRTRNEQHILDAAKGIESATGSMRDSMDTIKERVNELISQAQDPNAHEVENLDDEFATLDEALAGMEQVASTLRGVATQSGGGSPTSPPSTSGAVETPGVLISDTPATGAGGSTTSSTGGSSATDATVEEEGQGTQTDAGGAVETPG